MSMEFTFTLGDLIQIFGLIIGAFVIVTKNQRALDGLRSDVKHIKGQLKARDETHTNLKERTLDHEKRIVKVETLLEAKEG